MTTRSLEPGEARASRPAWWELLALALLALALRVWGLNHAPHFDELYHVLAGHSWLQDGDFCIAECVRPYGRGALFTLLVAGSFAVAGVDLVAARIPSALAGTLTVLLIFAWTYRQAGRGGGWAAGVLFAVAPLGIYMSQLSRFYALHALLFWLGALCVYLLAAGRASGWRAAGLAAAAAAAFAMAFHLQIITLIGLTALAVWLAVDPLPRLVRRYGGDRRFRWAAAGGLLVLGGAAAALVWSGELVRLWRVYRWSNLFAVEQRTELLFYHHWMYEEYGPLYAFLPAAAIVALARAARPALFCIVIFIVGFVVHSLGGFKGFRLVYWITPAFFVLWGIALAAVAAPLLALSRRAADRIAGFRLPDGWSRGLGAAGVLLAALFVVGNTDAFNTTVKLMTLTDDEWPASKPWYRGSSNWPAAEEVLQPLADTVEVVLTSSSPKALYYLDRSDASISANQLFGADEMDPEFTIDWRLGYPIVSQPESIRRIMRCHRSGLIVVERGHWSNRASVPPATSEFIEAEADRIPLPRRWRLEAFRWSDGGDPGDGTCDPPPLEAARPDAADPRTDARPAAASGRGALLRPLKLSGHPEAHGPTQRARPPHLALHPPLAARQEKTRDQHAQAIP